MSTQDDASRRLRPTRYSASSCHRSLSSDGQRRRLKTGGGSDVAPAGKNPGIAPARQARTWGHREPWKRWLSGSVPATTGRWPSTSNRDRGGGDHTDGAGSGLPVQGIMGPTSRRFARLRGRRPMISSQCVTILPELESSQIETLPLRLDQRLKDSRSARWAPQRILAYNGFEAARGAVWKRRAPTRGC